MANTHFHEFLSKFVRGAKQFLIVGSLAMLVSCSSNTDGADGTLDGSITQNAAVVAGTQSVQVESERVDLMASLAVLYPNGQLPLEKTAAATNDLAQNPAALSATAESAGLIKSQSASTTIQPQATSADFLPVTRIQNTTLYGAYFFSIYPTEVTSALAGNRNWRLEGPAFWASLATGTDLFPVHRFQNKQNGSYLYTIYDFERANIAANFSATFAYEGVAWYARQTPGTGWSPLYRFRNKTNGTYLFSAYESEKDAIVANYPDIFELEGIAYYVRQDAPVDAPIGTFVQSLSLTPSVTGNVTVGVSISLSAVASLSNGTTPNVTTSSTWASSSTAVATVSASGVITARAPGTTTITASYGGQTATYNLTVLDTFVQTLTLTPSVTGNVTVGVSSSLSAAASLSNGTTTNVTISSVWTSSNTAVATVSASGAITARAPGTTTITASYGGQSAIYNLTVVDAFVQTLTLTPTVTGTLPAGVDGKFVAVALFSNGTSKDVWAEAIWTSSNTTVATPSLFGTFNTIAPGATVITASYGGKSATYNLTVVNAVMTGLNLSVVISGFTAQPSVFAQGDVRKLKLEARYSNGTYVTVTGTWNSSVPSVATVDATNNLNTLAPGTTSISATYGGFTAVKNVTVATPRAVPLVTVTCNAATPMVISAATWNSAYATDPTNTTKWVVTDWATCGTRAVVQLYSKTTASSNFGYRVFEAVASPNSSFYPGAVTTSGSTPQLSAGSAIDVGYVSAAGNIVYNLLYTITIQ
jgi:Bacterial Ig-like domain (group 2)/Repeat of unknown function (DUF5648)